MKLKNSFWSTAKKKYSIYLILVGLFVICSFANPNFLSINNLTNISRQLSVTTILALGATMLIISGMLDLSSGSVLALAGVFAVSTYKATGSLLLAVAVGVLTGIICNALNALMISTFKAPPFIATLAMLTVARGAALLYTKGQNILQLGNFVKLGQGSIGVVPIPIIFLIAIAILTWYLLNHTRFGRSLYAVGGNEEAAIASGINVHKVKYTAFIINGIFVGIAGVLFMSRVNAGLPNGAINYEFTALTAAIIGGTSFSGGIGTVGGTLAGAFIVGFLDNIMNLNNVDSYMQQIVRGVIIALAVIYDIRSRNRRSNSMLVKEKEPAVSKK
ncbi:permease component of ribose/xylose/arabinose/galactoside ABC-type transporters [Desulfosporosinus orientis DSM 765]|uniref:Permease component of ribose/xylose/arabinose/galactoside ABC-type transporters n=1 Tax=Desulfosporosinus orientis (strain ATCC 19365 / DSM 765 / NCIMB 8382 / VKM B-1628 / Singapore I) TaxID=768706 RepID=G7WFH2_DESOD|nr:ABC transporter permease [Desulfosporosinus orientis]AET68415.1 permease component of ribose/xylose/arabinose/galactoside ABC-type transporters [Desulfosporosinus orientis DSM 765]